MALLAAWSISSLAQVKTTVYVMRNGYIVFQSPVSEIDNVTFDEASLDSTLVVHRNGGSPADPIRLNDIQQLSFSDGNLSVETSNGSEVYLYEDIMRLFFGGNNPSGIIRPPVKSGWDVLVSFTPAGDVMVESSVAIQSLTMFSVDGKIISKKHCKGVETQCIASLTDAGVYLLRVETASGATVKKVVKTFNK